MQTVHTAADPPNQGRICLAMSGWTRNSRNELQKMVAAKSQEESGLRIDQGGMGRSRPDGSDPSGGAGVFWPLAGWRPASRLYSAAISAVAAAGARSLAPLMKKMKTSRSAAGVSARRRLHARQFGRLFAGRPALRDICPTLEVFGRVAGLYVRLAAHQTCIDEVAGGIAERRVLVGIAEDGRSHGAHGPAPGTRRS